MAWSAVQYVQNELGLQTAAIATLSDLLEYLKSNADPALGDALCAATRGWLARAEARDGARPALHRGLIASGDRFVSSALECAALRTALPEVLAVEMEGAALAQVCADFERPFAVLRTISDRADASAHADFTRFIEEVASVYTRAIIGDWLSGRLGP